MAETPKSLHATVTSLPVLLILYKNKESNSKRVSYEKKYGVWFYTVRKIICIESVTFGIKERKESKRTNERPSLERVVLIYKNGAILDPDIMKIYNDSEF
jgi:hypothetical protein